MRESFRKCILLLSMFNKLAVVFICVALGISYVHKFEILGDFWARCLSLMLTLLIFSVLQVRIEHPSYTDRLLTKFSPSLTLVFVFLCMLTLLPLVVIALGVLGIISA